MREFEMKGIKHACGRVSASVSCCVSSDNTLHITSLSDY